MGEMKELLETYGQLVESALGKYTEGALGVYAVDRLMVESLFQSAGTLSRGQAALLVKWYADKNGLKVNKKVEEIINGKSKEA